MSIEALVLAVMSALRPAGLGAVSALLASPRPTRPLAAFVAAGLTMSVVSGVIVVTALHGVRVETGTSTVNAIIELSGGTAALGFAVGFASGRVQMGARAGRGDGDSGLVQRLRNPSARVAAGAGVLTHLPGLFYLLGLNAIASKDPGFVDGIIEVLIFDAIWLTIPVTALVFSVRNPVAVQDLIARASAWTHRHERTLLTIAFIGVGAYFTAHGIYDLLT